MRPALHYGVAECPGCGVTAASGLQLDVTGAVKLDLPDFQKGRKILRRMGTDGQARDLGPRFGPEHQREFAELRHEACGRTIWRSGPQAIEDAKAKNADHPLRDLAPLPIPERLGGPPASKEEP